MIGTDDKNLLAIGHINSELKSNVSEIIYVSIISELFKPGILNLWAVCDVFCVTHGPILLVILYHCMMGGSYLIPEYILLVSSVTFWVVTE